MKLRKMVRWQLILAGLAAALYFAPAAAYSQEITNTAFDDGPNVVTFAQADVVQPSTPSTPSQTGVPSLNEVTAIQASLSTPHAALIDSPWVAAGLTAILLAVIALSAIGGANRTRRTAYSSRRSPSYRGA